VASDFAECLELVRTKVKPERDRNNRAVYRNRWWQYAEKRPELYATIAGLARVMAGVLHTKYWTVFKHPTSTVFSHALVVFTF
jgi:hypothetical protein